MGQFGWTHQSCNQAIMKLFILLSALACAAYGNAVAEADADPAYHPFSGYRGYYGYAPVYRTLGKRDAEADADPAYHPFSGYSGYYGFAPAYHTLGKRDADAQQKISYIYGAPGYYGYYGYAFPGGY